MHDTVSFQVCSLTTPTFEQCGCGKRVQISHPIPRVSDSVCLRDGAESWSFSLACSDTFWTHACFWTTKPFYSLISHFCFSRKLASSYPASSMFSSVPVSFQCLLSALIQFPIYLFLVYISYLQLSC